MDEQLPNISTGITAFLGTLLLAGIVCLIKDIINDYKKSIPVTRTSLPAWKTGWLEFFIFLNYTFLSILFLQLLVGAGHSLVGEAMLDETWQTIGSGIAMHLAIILAVLVGIHIFPAIFEFTFNLKSMSYTYTFGTAAFYFLAAIPLVLPIAMGWNYVLMQLAEAGLADMPVPQSIVVMVAQTNGIWKLTSMASMAILLAPISEELLFRGCIYRFLKGKLRPIAANTITSFLFALMHMNAAAFIPLFLLSMLLCRSYEKTGNLYTCIIFHAFFNLNTFFIIILQDNQYP